MFRQLTGRPSTDQISDTNVNKEINDYYVNHFSHDAKVDEFNIFFTQALSATDTGIYSLGSNIDRLDDPVTINGREIVLERDREVFFGVRDYHHHHFLHFIGTRTTFLHSQYKDEQFITDPTLAIGTNDTKKVKHSDFSYEIKSKSYSKSSSEVALTGEAIPSGLYGAWSLKIDTDGTITVAAASDNVTGYATPRIALDALNVSDSDSAYMGYVTVTKSDGAFTPDTTALDASNVTDTYTDGKFENRGEPTSALLFGSNLYVRPKPNDIYELEALSIADRPTAFADDDAVPDDAKWGPVIASMSALFFLQRNGEDAIAAQVAVVAKKYMSSIRADKVKRLLGQVVQRSY
ncbi:MAG TPA: hypothetical protein ENH87_00545 [Pricia antarctica]|uniref:Uncharacterized protein n=1 Tax=Pricia antarctica TaxID=641691 RepID=A0A831VL81_9FLAO|nr:hypothetical protein [Pricia antarctica]